VDPYEADISMDIGDISVQTIDMDAGTSMAHSSLVSTNTHDENPSEFASHIPSESSIKVAKEKRGRLRQTQATGEEDFISLSVAKRDDGPQGPHPESRLMREEDELGEGDDGKPLPCLRPSLLYFFLQNSRSTQALKKGLRWARNPGKRRPLNGGWQWKR
jgi:hypothetical protein